MVVVSAWSFVPPTLHTVAGSTYKRFPSFRSAPFHSFLPAFNHILGDVSLVVYQFESLAGFSAIIDRLGQFREILEDDGGTAASLSSSKEAPALDKGNDSPGTAKLTNGVATISVVETDVGNTGDTRHVEAVTFRSAPGCRASFPESAAYTV